MPSGLEETASLSLGKHQYKDRVNEPRQVEILVDQLSRPGVAGLEREVESSKFQSSRVQC